MGAIEVPQTLEYRGGQLKFTSLLWNVIKFNLINLISVMAESSSHNPSSPEITPKKEPVTLKKPKSPNPFLHADQIEFSFDEIAFTTNNEVALLYPSHPNSKYFREVSTPTGGIGGDMGITTFRNALRTHYISHSSMYVPSPSIIIVRPWFLTIGYNGEVKAQRTLKKSCLPPRWRLLMGQIIQCLGGKIGKKLGAKSGLRRKQSSKHTSESHTEASKSKTGQSKKETQSSSAKDKSPSHPSPSTSVVSKMHKEAQQAVGGPTSLEATNEESAHPQLNSWTNPSVLVDQTKYVVDGLKTAHTDSDESEEDETKKDEDTHATSHNIPEDTSVLHPPSLKSAQIQELMAQVAKLKNIQWKLPTKFLDLPSQISSIQKKLKTLDFLLSLLNKFTETLNRFATVVENASGAKTKNVPLAG
uniref:Uncharacterized protein n=1 Tax=Tanacetum cinerariifolium TaxID=118510 RepID=A0A6L2LIS0_TANCI|nr:hypothetical protein [Tanacetum cinerariifolium]